MAGGGFLDFISNSPYVQGALPSFLTGLLVKKPNIDLGSLAGYYGSIANAAANSNDFANEQARFFNDQYRPSAVAFNDRAQSVGRGADLNEASDRGAADFQSGFKAVRDNATRSMAGINPNSGGAMARMGAIDASYVPGLVDSMNKARSGREQYGDTLRKEALPFLATSPNFATPMAGLATAAGGAANLGKLQNDMYRQEAGDTVKALKLPFDIADNQRREQQNQQNTGGIIDAIKKRFPMDEVPNVAPSLYSALDV